MATNPGLTTDDPTYIEMGEIIRSKEGLAAVVKAALAGIPALCGVDPLLCERLGPRYRTIDLGTASAGDYVANLMRELGFKQGPARRCPDGCLAKTAILWIAPAITT